MKLYEIAKEIENCYDRETGEYNVERVTELNLDLEKKVGSIVHVLKNILFDRLRVKEEKKRLTEYDQKLKNNEESLLYYLGQNINESIKNAEFEVKINNSEFVEEELSQEQIKDIFETYPELVNVTYSIDKLAIKEFARKGLPLPNGIYIQKRKTLKIK